MKARLFVVDSESYKRTINEMEVSVSVPTPNSTLWNKTFIDIVADMLQITLGDYIFLWEVRSDLTNNRIHGVYRVVSPAYYDYRQNDPYPLRVRIAKAYEFNNSIEEYDILNDSHFKANLWTIIGKKVAGKSRASTPITNFEMDYLIKKLIEVNPDYKFIDKSPVLPIPTGSEGLFLNLTEESVKFTNSLSDMKLKDFGLLYSPNSKKPKYEKTLEAILNQLFLDRNTFVLKGLDISLEHVVWYANYLPYSIEKSEIDYLVIESIDGLVNSSYSVFELQRDEIDIDHINRVVLYSKWISDNLCYGVMPLVTANIVCSGNLSTTLSMAIDAVESRNTGIKLKVFSYEIQNGNIVFFRLR